MESHSNRNLANILVINEQQNHTMVTWTQNYRITIGTQTYSGGFSSSLILAVSALVMPCRQVEPLKTLQSVCQSTLHCMSSQPVPGCSAVSTKWGDFTLLMTSLSQWRAVTSVLMGICICSGNTPVLLSTTLTDTSQ